MRTILCGCLFALTLFSQAQSEIPTPWQMGTMTDEPAFEDFEGSVLFSTFSGIAPMSFAPNSQVFTVSGGMTGIPAGYANAAADDFTIPAGDAIWTIEVINVQGAYFNGPGPAQSVNVYILGNSGGLPDSTNLSAASIYAAENLSYTDVGSGDFEIDLPGSGLSLAPGTYWLVVQANMDAFSAGQWGWRESSASADTGTMVGFESAWFENAVLFNTCVGAWGARITTCNVTQPPNGTGQEFDLAFSLRGTAVSPDIFVMPTAGLETSEANGMADFQVVLSGPPTDTVDVPIMSSDVTEGVVSVGMLSFTSANWDIPQTVTITGQDDAIADGNVAYNITVGPATSMDMRFDGIDPPDVSVLNFDNEIAGLTVSPLMVSVTEGGAGMDFDVSLNTGLGAGETVTVPLSVSDTSEVTLSAQAMSGSSISIVLDNGTPTVTVTVDPLDDAIDDGTVMLTGITGDPTSSNGIYDALTAADVADVIISCLDDADAAGITVTPSMVEPMQTDEAMTLNPTFEVVLDSEPTADVEIPLFSSDPSEGSMDQVMLTFTPLDWFMPQTVTLTGANDDIDDETVSYAAVTVPANSGDANYQGIDAADVNMENLDDADTTGVTVTPNGTPPLQTDEAGTLTATFDVVLTSEPLFDVSIDLASDDLSEGTLDLATLTFTSANWDTPQTVSATGVDDPNDDGDINYNAVLDPAITNDPTYTGFDPNDVALVNLDDDSAGIDVTPTSGLITSEDPMGPTATFDVVLLAQPTNDVTIDLASDDLTEGATDVTQLVFTDMNWDTPQTVTVTGADDLIFDGDVAYGVITNPAVSMDPAYSDLDPADVLVTNLDDEICTPVTIMVQIDGPIVVNGSPGCVFDLYSNACDSDNSQWILIASGITIGPDGQAVVPGVIGTIDTCYVATVVNDIDQPLNMPVRTVPTLGTAAMIVLFSLLLATGLWILRRRRAQA